MLMTSLAEIKRFTPCVEGWKAILKGQRKTKTDAVLFPLVDCVDSNSISDVCWLLGKRKLEIQIAVKFAKACADSVSYLRNSDMADTFVRLAYASDASALAASAAAYASDASAYAAAYAAVGAALAASAAAYASDASALAAAYAAVGVAREKQNEKNKQFLRDAINNFRKELS